MDVHNGVAAQRSSRGKVIGPQQGGNDAVRIHLPYHGPIHKVDQSVLVNGNPWREMRMERNVQVTQLCSLLA